MCLGGFWLSAGLLLFSLVVCGVAFAGCLVWLALAVGCCWLASCLAIWLFWWAVVPAASTGLLK